MMMSRRKEYRHAKYDTCGAKRQSRSDKPTSGICNEKEEAVAEGGRRKTEDGG
jgi:hypothetical protein